MESQIIEHGDDNKLVVLIPPEEPEEPLHTKSKQNWSRRKTKNLDNS